MKSSIQDGKFRPFADLGQMLQKDALPVAVPTCTSNHQKMINSRSVVRDDADTETALFREAMADVIPLKKGKYVERRAAPKSHASIVCDPDEQTVQKLERLVKKGEGFIIADTSGYIEGTGRNVHPDLTRQLHHGKFSIQAHVDLHGFCVFVAENVFHAFLKEAIQTGKRAVLVVHGRGLSSPDKPVLKYKVVEWLTKGPFRKWVLAFTSARMCDGGTGATYILLRHRPLTKRFLK